VTVRVLIVDDQEPFRRAAADVIARTPGFVTVAEAASGEEAVEATLRFAPDLVLMDVSLPGIDGLEAGRKIREASPKTAVVFVSTYSRADFEPALSEVGGVFIAKAKFGPHRILDAWRSIQEAPASRRWRR
jgi:DNA-binding NarL/FixJ family response regulator